MERKVLGRGLEALIPADQQAIRERVQMLNVSQIHPSRFQPRLTFLSQKIEELARSIKEKGVIQPVIVRSVGPDQYELIAGERRLRAIKHLGVNEIPAIIRRVPDAEVLEMSLIENIQREELNSIEEAKAYKRLSSEFGLTQETIAERVGKDKSSVSNLLRLLNLPEKIQDFLSRDLITFGHARALLSFGDPKRQLSVCEKVIHKGLSVRQVEFLAARRTGLRSALRISAKTQDSNIKDLQHKLEHVLGTKVRIHHGKKRGKIEIEYYSLEDLERVLKLLQVTIS